MKNKALLAVIVVLIATVAVLGYFNQKLIANKDQSKENPEVLITFQNEEVGKVSLDTIKTLGEENFRKTLRSSGAPPEDHVYKGVAMKRILDFVDENLIKKGRRIIVKALDGYVSMFYMKEVEDENNIYLVYEQDGKALKSMKEGGNGPLMIVAAKDTFGQRWCKYVVEVDIE